jgi:hypothetical protein
MHRHVKTVILALVAALLVASAALAAGKPKAVAVEPIKDAGSVSKGDKAVYDFLIRNDGDAPLEITNVQPACGCTVAEFDKTVAPGKTGKVHVSLDTATFNGPVAKGVSVFTSDPDNPKIELTVRANVAPAIIAKPGYARYITVQDEPKEGTISQTLWAPDGAAWEIVRIESPWPYLTATFHEAKDEEKLADYAGRQWKVDMKLSNDAPVGALSDFVTIHTNHPKQKVVRIPISGFVRPAIAVTPTVADFGELQLKEPLKKTINIRSFSTTPIKVTGVEQNVKGINVALESLEEGREYQVRFTLNPDLPKGPFAGKLLIHTDSPRRPLIEVEVKGIVM